MVAIRPCGSTEDHPPHSTHKAPPGIFGGFHCPGFGPEGLQWYLNPDAKPKDPPPPFGDNARV